MSSDNHLINLNLADRDWYLDELYIDWRAASAEADASYSAWKAWPHRDLYAPYIAATDQADAAADHLAAAQRPDRAAHRRPSRRRLFAWV